MLLKKKKPKITKLLKIINPKITMHCMESDCRIKKVIQI